MQPDLFPVIDPSRKAARAEAVKLARQRGERLGNLAAEKVDALHADWCEQAVEKLRELAKRIYPGKFTVETARLAINFPVPEGGDLRAWGEVTRRALALGYIKHVPRTQAAASSNGAQKCMYEKGPKA